jgi:signal transduction histidine kinase
MTYTTYIWPPLIAAFILSGIAIYLRRFWKVRAAHPCMALLWLGACWALISAFTTSATSLPLRVTLLHLQFMPAAFTSVAALALTLEFSGRGPWLTRAHVALLFIVPIVAIALEWTSQVHTLFRFDYKMDLSGPLPVMLMSKGPAYWAYIVYTSAVVLVTYWLLFTTFSINTRHFRSTTLIFIGLAIPFTTEMLYNIGITLVPGFDLAPSTTGIAGIFLGWALYRFQLFDVTPIAHDTIMDNMADLVIVLDTRNRIVDSNRAAQVVCHIAPQKAADAKAILPPDWAELFARFERATANRKEVSLGSGDAQHVYELTVSPIRDELSRVLGRLFLFHDVTAQRRHEVERERLLQAEAAARREAERANELRLRFLGMISHELRTPLAAIKGFATTLLAEDVNWDAGSQRDFIETIDEEADKLTELIDQLLDLSRIESGALRVDPQRASLDDILAGAMPQLKALLQRHELRVDVPAGLPAMLADWQRVAQVLTNLVGNAAKYSPPLTTITLSAEPAGADVLIRVCDQGPGIPAEERAEMFDAFQRGNYERVRRIKGAGLGLAICKGIVEAHGGRIWIDGHDGPGTMVCFTLPVADN